MRAAIGLDHGRHLSVEDVELTPMGPRDVMVKVGASGVCHTDVAVLGGHLPVPLPVILGHEGAGVVEAIGPEVTSLAVGDRVIGSVGGVCGRCWYCANSMTHLCTNGMVAAAEARVVRADGSGVPAFVGLGSFAEMMTAHETSLVKVHTDLPDEQLALIGCAITTGLGAVFNTARVTPGSSVAIIGCGGVGQAVVQGARIAGAAEIIAIDPSPMKRSTATSFGASHSLDPNAGDVADTVRALTGGRGADYTFEVVGQPATISQAWDLARPGGTVTVVGMPPTDATITMSAFALASEDKRLCGSLYGGTQAFRDIPLIVKLVETGRLELGAMVTRRLPLDDIDDAIRALEAGEEIRSVVV